MWLSSSLLVPLLFTTSVVTASLGQQQYQHQQRAAAPYRIQDSYDASNFFDEFEFFSGPDPTEGFVRYQTALEANDSALAGYADGGVFLGVDYKTGDVGQPGRASTRVNTKKKYTRGLFVADIAHMPSSTCGVWAAFWSFGDPWPSAGEIDIIEGVNRDKSTKFTLHTASGCSFSKQGGDCNAPGDGTKGCTNPGFSDPLSYGTGFNDIGGGVYVTEWTSQAIRFWFFPRTRGIPKDLATEQPDPSTWGPPAAEFSGAGAGASCDIDSHFREHRLVFNTALCGQWAGRVFSQDAQCASLASSCEEYVANNPQAFASAYWLINSVKVFSRELEPAASAASGVNRLSTNRTTLSAADSSSLTPTNLTAELSLFSSANLTKEAQLLQTGNRTSAAADSFRNITITANMNITTTNVVSARQVLPPPPSLLLPSRRNRGRRTQSRGDADDERDSASQDASRILGGRRKFWPRTFRT